MSGHSKNADLIEYLKFGYPFKWDFSAINFSLFPTLKRRICSLEIFKANFE